MNRTSNRQVFDIETLADTFTATFENYDTGEVRQFVCWNDRNDINELRTFWQSITHVIGFNSEAFDNPVIDWLLSEKSVTKFLLENEIPADLSTLSGKQWAELAYYRAQTIIQLMNDRGNYTEEEQALRKEIFFLRKQAKYTSIDLFLYWSKMLRLSKKLSLKFFAHNLGMSIIEMPIHHTHKGLTQQELQLVLDYNKQDVAVTRALAVELKEQINLRGWIAKEYGLPCWSMDAPKISQKLILKDYCKTTGKDEREVAKRRYTKPNPLFIKRILPTVIFKTDFFKQVYEDMRASINGFSREYLYRNPNGSYLKLSFGIGGVHSIQKNEKWLSTNFLKIKTVDVGSLYPTLILNNGYVAPDLGTGLLRVYGNIKKERLQAKKAKEKQKDALLKLCLNGFSGLADSEKCWLYSPEQILAMRLHGQLLMSRLMEELGLVGINVISSNTDGLELIIRPDQEELLKSIIQIIEQEFTVEFEMDEYKAIYYKTVNDYLAITSSGKVKQKGEFVSEKQIDSSNEFLVIPKALKAYWVEGIDPSVFIKKHQSVFDFCSAKKIDKKYQVWYRGEKAQQLNRYLVSTKAKGAYLYKQKPKGKLENVLKDTPVYLLNETCDKPAQQYPIDYNFYIQKTWETIRLFEPIQYDLFSSVEQQAA